MVHLVVLYFQLPGFYWLRPLKFQSGILFHRRYQFIYYSNLSSDLSFSSWHFFFLGRLFLAPVYFFFLFLPLVFSSHCLAFTVFIEHSFIEFIFLSISSIHSFYSKSIVDALFEEPAAISFTIFFLPWISSAILISYALSFC